MSFTPIPSTSLQFVPVDIKKKQAGNVLNPTADAVAMAFISGDALPASGDWKTATWETNSNPNPDIYTALCLVGPGGTITLTAGEYSVYVKVTDSPEIPVIPVPGLLTVL